MSASEFPPNEGLDPPELAVEPGDVAPSADVAAPAGVSRTDGESALADEPGDTGFGEAADATAQGGRFGDSTFSDGRDDSPEAKAVLDELEPADVTQAQADGIRDWAERERAAQTPSGRASGDGHGTTSIVNGDVFVNRGEGITIIGGKGIIDSRPMSDAEVAAFTRDTAQMAADLGRLAQQGGGDASHVNVTGPAEINFNGHRISVGHGETFSGSFPNGDGAAEQTGDPVAEAFTAAAAAQAHADLDARLAATLGHIDEALAGARAGTAADGTAADAPADGQTAAQQAQLAAITRTARGYQDSAFGPPAATAETDEAGDGQSPDGITNSAPGEDAMETVYARAGEQDQDLLRRADWQSRNPTYGDGALQERYGRDDARQGELKDAYAAARARYDAALVAHNRYWDYETHEERQAVSDELTLARDQFSAAGELLYSNNATRYDTALSNGSRYINGIQIAETATAADAGDRPAAASPRPERYVGAPVLEHPHVGERFETGDRSANRSAGERSRLRQLEALPYTGFTLRAIQQVREQIAALGYPVDNFRQFIHKENERGTEDANTIASWLGHGHGEFTVYDLYERQIPEKRLGTLGHETAHANSPLKPENAGAFAGEQAEAVRYVEAVARQSLETGIHLNGYHKYLMQEYKTNTDKLRVARDGGEITEREYAAAQAEVSRKYHEETWAIMNEMALTNRAGLADVQARQHQAIDDHNRRSSTGSQRQKTDLVTTPGRNGEVPETSRGIDTWLVRLLDGVNDQRELEQHVVNLKQRFYNQNNNQKAEARRRNQYGQAA